MRKVLGLESITNLNKEKLNIAVVHGTVDGSNKIQMIYNPMSSKKLIEAGFDYVACGHIHKREYFENKKIEVPKTGDESSIKLIGGILILSILGIAYIIIHNHNKKKQD